MINQIINFSIRNKLIIILFTLTIAAFGIFAVLKIPVGAVPDITNNQVQVITVSSNLSTQDVEQFITYPVELEMANLPGVKEIRSISKFGLSVVTIVFDDDLGTYLPRQLIAEKIKTAAANIPEGFGTPEMGPITTGLGEVYQYILDTKPGYANRYSPMELRTIQDWIVKRQLSGITGVVEVNTWGGFLKQYEIAINPEQLKALNITLLEVFNALNSNNSVAGGAYIEKQNKSYFIRGDGMVKSIEEIGSIVVKNKNGIPVLLQDIAAIHFGYANRFGAITANGEGEKVLGQIMMLKDANSKKVINEVKKRVDEVQKSLPEGVFINPIIERSELISKTSFTVAENLILGCLIVMFIVVILLGNIRSALVIASIIPLALLFTISLMYIFGVDANLMSLGALDFGIIIDGAVIIVEYIAIKITTSKDEYESADDDQRQSLMDKITFDGASKMINSAIFGQIIILVVLIPIFTLSGVEGKMFRPMATSFSFAILGAMILGLTWLPVASSLFLKPEKENKKSLSKWIMNIAYRSYCPVIKWSYDHKNIIFAMAIASLILTGYLFGRMGGEFVPTLDEGDFVIQPVLKTGTSLSKTVELTTQMEKILKETFPEVDQIVCRIGAAEVPTDPMSMEEIDMIIKLKPKKEWVSAKSKEELADKFKEALLVIPGIDYEFTQPIEMRFNELITGVRSDIAVKIFGEDLDYLNDKAIEIKKLIDKIPGAADVILEKTAGLPQISVTYQRQKIAAYGLNIEELNQQLTMAFGGEMAGSVFEGEKRFDMVVRFQEPFRKDIDHIKGLQIGLHNGNQVPLTELADIFYTTGPAKISRENTHRRVVVSVNVRNRDLESVIKDIQASIGENVKLNPGTYITYGGQFENLQNATRRLMLAVPVALLLIFIFLHFAFKSIKDAVLIFTAVPLSAVGGVLFLWIRGMPFSVSAGIGFIALFGVAVLNGIVLIEHLKDLKESGMTDMRELILKATRERLRPVMLTAAAAALGFLPMAISTSSGAEVQRPLATVVIGGLVTSTMLTMIALPLLFMVFNTKHKFKLSRFSKMIKTILLLGIVGASSSLYAQEGNSETQNITIDQAVEMALTNNPVLKNAGLSIQSAKKGKQAILNFAPTEFSYQKGQMNSKLIDHSWEINQNFGSLLTHYQTSKFVNQNIALSHTEFEIAKKEITVQTKIAWFNWIHLINQFKIKQEQVSLFSEFVRIAQLKYKMGETNLLEQTLAETEFAKSKNELQKINEQLLIAENNLKQIMNSEGDFLPASDSMYIYQLPAVQKDSERFDNSIITDFYQNKYNLENTKYNLERSKYFPEISAGYFSQQIDQVSGFTGWSIGISVPLWFLPQNSSVQQAKIEKEKAFNTLEYQRFNLSKEIENLVIQLDQLQNDLIYYYENALKKAEVLSQTAQIQFEKEEIEYFEFLQSIKTAQDIKSEYLTTLYNYNKTAIELEFYTK
ncbi:MAG: multidrug transporter AcrB [Bacteroidetes bacterium GWF2_33_16]|nr:MAG: multidrug transporter AcrB [Bacteroidetes bacterium GWE2_32_14]OFY04053.1 MAG: multidrug transporter AcrB [Bacteroidetes bacterium GWF2_33_16]